MNGNVLPNGQKCLISHPSVVINYRGQDIERRSTIVVAPEGLDKDGEMWFLISESTCSDKDNFSKKVGRNIAMNRMMSGSCSQHSLTELLLRQDGVTPVTKSRLPIGMLSILTNMAVSLGQ